MIQDSVRTLFLFLVKHSFLSYSIFIAFTFRFRFAHRMWMCSHCSKSFASARALKIHEVKQHENATRHVLKCGTCDEEFEHANLLHIHMRVHHNVKVRCPRCKDIFEHPNVLKLHYKTHHSEPVCVACGLKFDHDKLLRLHLEHYHKIDSKGGKKCVTASGGRKSKGSAEEEMAVGVCGESMAAVDQGNVDSEVHEEMRQVKDDESRDKANGVVTNQWDYDDDAMSHDSSDSRDEGSSDVEIEDIDKGFEPGFRQAESPVEPEKQDQTESHVNCRGQPQCSRSPHQCKGETESFLSNTDSGNNEGDVKKERACVSSVAVEWQNPTRPRRSSVIVTTGSASPPLTHSKHKVKELRECTQETPKFTLIVTDWDASSKGSPRSPSGSYAESPASTMSGDESGDSESTSPRARSTKRVTTLRCNRCQEEFLSKMEYLHHLISHQKGDELNKAENDMSPESKAFEKLKSSLRIKMEVRREDRSTDDETHEFEREVQKGASPGRDTDDPMFSDISRTSPPSYKEAPSRNLSVPCTLCSEQFSDWRELKAHVESRHKRPHCSECGLQFDHKNLLKIHMNSYHSSLDVLQCYQCGKSFGNRSEFVSHVTSHETSLKGTKDIRKEHKPLRRMSSAPVPGENLSRFRSQGPMLLARDRSGISRDLGDNGEVKERGDQVLHPVKSQIDDLRPFVNRLFPSYGVFRHHKQETITSQEQGDWYRKVKGNLFTVPESKTRIFLPKCHEDVGHDREHLGVKRRLQVEREEFSPGNAKDDYVSKKPASSEEATTARISAFSAYERTSRSDEVTRHPILGRAKRDRDGLPIGGPPPLIPVVHPGISHSFAQTSDAGLLRVHRPVTRTASANSALRYPRMLPFPTQNPTLQSSRWGPDLEPAVPSSPVRDSPRDPPELPSRESINNITKEALLHSLSLRRRASAPELGALVKPLAEPRSRAAPEPIKNPPGNRLNNSEKTESALATSSGRLRQLNEGYQPRRKHPRDFTCHHCGIYFGHKKLLKIHLDCYHGSAQELQCLRCEKNFSSRSEFLEHLMSHEGGDELLAIQRKRLRLDRRSSLPHEGETVIRHELNSTVAKETTPKKETVLRDEPKLADTPGELRKPLLNELKTRIFEVPTENLKPNGVDVKRESRVSNLKLGNERRENDSDGGSNFCFVCGQSFTSGKKLEHHISSHAVVDQNGRYCCSLCQKSFDHHRKLEIHTRSHTGFKPHKCELCGRSFPYYSSYYYHKMTHTEDRPHKCGVCGKGFIQTRYLRSHMKTHKEQNGWASDEELDVDTVAEQVKKNDGANTTKNSPFRETEAQIETEPTDQKGYSSQGELEEHDTARILCSFKQSSNVGMRTQRLSKDDQRDSELRDDLVLANGSHSEDTPSVNQTEEANFGALEDSQLKGTQGLSDAADAATNVKKETTQGTNDESPKKTKKKKYKCKHCEKNFSSYSSLHVHVRIHTGHRPYSCNHCFKKFTHSSGLKRHVRCHTGEKPYPCPACPSAFADRGALKSHIRTHTGERPFVCDFCNKSFTQPSSLRVHKKTVHAHEFFDEK